MLASVLLTGCGGLSKMKSKSNKVRYQANPNPVETMDDKVVVKFTGQIPEKYFDKGCAMFIQPVFSWAGGDIPLEPITLKGERVDGDGTIINYAKGGRFTYSDMFDFKPGMETGRVTLTPVGYKAGHTNEDARFMEDVIHTNQGEPFTTVLLSDGVNNTSSWVDIKGNISIAPINYNKTQGIVETADIYFLNGITEGSATEYEEPQGHEGEEEVEGATFWEGNSILDWGNGLQLTIPGSQFEGKGNNVRLSLSYTQEYNDYDDIQLFFGDWSAQVKFTVGNQSFTGDFIPSNYYFTGSGTSHVTTMAFTEATLNTILQRGVVILPKSTKPERMAQNKDLFDFTLTDEEMEQITAKSLDHSEIINHFDPKLVQFLNRRNIHD